MRKVKVKTSELSGQALDWAVSKCEGYQPVYTDGSLRPVFRKGEAVESTWPAYSTDWSAGGPIMQKCRYRFEGKSGPTRRLFVVTNVLNDGGKAPYLAYADHSLLVAYMRCYVGNMIGDEVDVPEGLLGVAV